MTSIQTSAGYGAAATITTDSVLDGLGRQRQRRLTELSLGLIDKGKRLDFLSAPDLALIQQARQGTLNVAMDKSKVDVMEVMRLLVSLANKLKRVADAARTSEQLQSARATLGEAAQERATAQETFDGAMLDNNAAIVSASVDASVSLASTAKMAKSSELSSKSGELEASSKGHLEMAGNDEQQAAKLSWENDSLQTRNTELGADNAQRRKSNDELTESNKVLREKNTELETQVQELQRNRGLEADEADDRVGELQSEIAQNSATIKANEETIAGNDDGIKSNNAEIAKNKDHIAENEKTIEFAHEDAKRLQGKAADEKAQAKTLSDESAHLHKVADQITAFGKLLSTLLASPMKIAAAWENKRAAEDKAVGTEYEASQKIADAEAGAYNDLSSADEAFRSAVQNALAAVLASQADSVQHTIRA